MRIRRWRIRRRDRTRMWRTIRITAVLLVTAWMLFGTLGNLEAMMLAYSDTCCRNLLTQAVAECISELKMDEKYFCFTDVENQNIIRMDHSVSQQYQAELALALSERLRQLSEQEFPVPLGTALDSRLLLGRGPEIPLQFQPIGSVTTNLRSSLQSAGINQVLYCVVLDLSIQVSVILPGKIHLVTHEQQVILEEVLLCGEVPYVYSG